MKYSPSLRVMSARNLVAWYAAARVAYYQTPQSVYETFERRAQWNDLSQATEAGMVFG